MLNRRNRIRRKGESGQTLILALAFIAFFGVVTVSVLRVADLAGVAHSRSETTALNNSLSEGGGAYGAADASRPDVSLTCASNDSGRLTMQGGDQANYTVSGCSSLGGLGSGPGPGPGCLLCILNQAAGSSPTTIAVKVTCAQCVTAALVTTGGDDYINGSISSNSSMIARESAGPPATLAKLKLVEGASANGCSCEPTPTFYAPAITDPLACVAGNPSAVCAPGNAPEPLICTTSASCTPDTPCHLVPGGTWSPTLGCSITFTSTQAAVGPGLYNNLVAHGNPSTEVTLDDSSGSPGVYVITGILDVSGNASVKGADDFIYLACTNFTSIGQPCSGSGGSVSFGGNGSTTISAPTTGPYKSLAVLSDPSLIDPGGTGSCQGGGGCMYSTSGNGASITGSIDTRNGGISIGGNAGQTISSGRLIANSLFMNVSGNVGSGLALSGGPGNGVSPSSCGVFDFNPVTGTSVSVSSYGSAGSSTGRAVVQSQCNTNNVSDSGATVTYTANTLTDSQLTWAVNQWVGATVLAGSNTLARVASNTAHTLTLTANWSTTPAAGTSYSLSVGSGIIYFNYVP